MEGATEWRLQLVCSLNLVSIPMCLSWYVHFTRVKVILVFTNTHVASIQSLNTSQLLHKTSTEEVMVCFNTGENKCVEFMKPICQSPTWHHPM